MTNQEAIAQLEEINREAHIYSEAVDMAINALESQKHTCHTCDRSSDNCEHTTTRCPIEEHYALPKDGYCHLWKEIKNDER
jgi:hypothetical protein